MVHVSTPRPNIGAALGQALTQVLGPRLEQQYQRGLLQQSLGEAQQAFSAPGAKPIDKLFAFMKAGAGIPGSERYLQTLLPEVLRIAQAEAAQRAPIAGEARQPFNEQVMQSPQLPQFGQIGNIPTQIGGKGQFFPSNIGQQAPVGNLPQPETEGIIKPIIPREKLIPAARQLAAERSQAGIPTTPAQAMEELQNVNAENAAYNAKVEEDRRKRIAGQREYGNLAVEKLLKVLPEATDEQQAYFKRKGEEAAGRSLSEADTERFLSKEATKFKNMISNIKNDISPARSYNKIYQDTLGIGKDYEKAKNDQRIKLAPLLREGLYDTARNILSQIGYYPEEREDVITDLSEGASKSVREMPQIKKTTRLKPIQPGEIFRHEVENFYTPQQHEQVNSVLTNALSTDPSANLILLRREFERKGVDWREFKDSLNNLIQSEQFEPNDDQFNQISILDQPPLNNLEKILHGLKLIGR